MPQDEFAEQHARFVSEGLAVLPGLFSENEIATHIRAVTELRAHVNSTKDEHGFGDRIGQGHQKDPRLMRLAANPQILRFLSGILNDQPLLFGSLNFDKGTEQRIHIDAIFFWPRPCFSMAGVWIALEDVDEHNGGLAYIPGSHRWPLIRSEDVVANRPALAKARAAARSGRLPPERKAALLAEIGNAWSEDFMNLAAEKKATPVTINVKRGDTVVWHSLLAHGGAAIADRSRSRRSVVFHFLGRHTKLFSFEKFMLLNRSEFTDSHAESTVISQLGELSYIKYPYFVTYENGTQTVHDL